MSKIPYYFETPVPTYFRKNGWFTPRKDGGHLRMIVFLNWCFSRCNAERRRVFHDHKEIQLEPFEFIFGRRVCSEETGLTEMEIRTIINQLISHPNGPILEKTTNSVTNRFTCYKWVTERFSENNNQQNNQPPTNRQPTDNHKLEERNKNKEEIHTDDLAVVENDDFSLDLNENNVITDDSGQHNIYYQTTNSEESKNKLELIHKKTNKVKTKKSKEPNPNLVERRPNIHTSDEQHKKLIDAHEEELVNAAYDHLDRWKESKKQTDPKIVNAHTDYYRITQWVFKAVEKERSLIVPSNNFFEINKKYAQGIEDKYKSLAYGMVALNQYFEFTPLLSGRPHTIEYSLPEHAFKNQIQDKIRTLKFEEIGKI